MRTKEGALQKRHCLHHLTGPETGLDSIFYSRNYNYTIQTKKTQELAKAILTARARERAAQVQKFEYSNFLNDS